MNMPMINTLAFLFGARGMKIKKKLFELAPTFYIIKHFFFETFVEVK
jgi:hypothetical protein